MEATATEHQGRANILELATFYIGDALCGMDIQKVQEINKHLEMTQVPQAPEYVLGILNLRGQIVTVIDLGKKLGLTPTERTEKTRNIIVNSQDEYIGLLVEKISEVVQAPEERIEPPPANIGNVQGKFFSGVFKTDQRLIGIINEQQVLRVEN